MDYKMIHYTVEKSIATITLDYAPTLNALDMNMSLEVESALKEAEADQAGQAGTGGSRCCCGCFCFCCCGCCSFSCILR